MSKPLTVYKASAGSGKTFTLAVEYIKLLVANPTAYRQTLAVTFTNKATEEMKTRILSELYGIWKQLPSAKAYTEEVCTQLNITQQKASEKAEKALKNLLHDYSYFRVETIDSFFQSVLRNLARELGLTANLRVNLNDYQVEEEAVDTLIDNLKSSDPLLLWLMKYITDNINDDKSWNVIWQIKKFGQYIFSDFYKRHADDLRQKSAPTSNFFEEYTKLLKKLQKDELDKIHCIAATFFDTINEHGLTEDNFSNGKSGIYGYFLKLQNDIIDNSIVGKRVRDAMLSADKWGKKKDPLYPTVEELAQNELMRLLNEAESIRPNAYRNVQSAKLTMRHLSQLRLLSTIEDKVREINALSSQFLLSDTQSLLHGLIDKNDSPFIYEKIGSRLEHIMIDEFQDTSNTQWQNFKVLLDETMSHSGATNLIVGDVKQSIYRWRSGDWRLLNSMTENEQIHEVTLDTNWRSDKNIVDFNNAFFKEAVEQERQRLKNEGIDGSQLDTAYAKVEQKVGSKSADEGYVKIELIKSDDFEADNNKRMASHIRELLDSGCKPNDICILVRSNKHIPIIAEYMMHEMPDVKLVSDEAFRLDASQAVNIIVLAMYNLTNKADKLSLAKLAKLYQQVVLGRNDSDQQLLLLSDYNSLLPTDYVRQRESLLAMPLYDMAEELYSMFQLESLNSQSAYICAFFDQLSGYTADHPAEITSFLNEWELNISAITIQSDEAEGIRIISIHKSKGLEAPHVIIPYCNWKMEITNGVQIWCEPNVEPFKELPLAAIDYSAKHLIGTIYENDYKEEHLQNTVDNLNLLYVAFTRAKRSLYVIGQKGGNGTRSNLIEKVLPTLAEGTCESDDESLTFTLGSIPTEEPKKGKSIDNVFQQSFSPHPISVRNYPVKAEFRQSNRSRDFINGETTRTAYIQTGTILHKIFSTIRTTDDIPYALAQLEREGVLYSSQVSQSEINSRIAEALGSTMAKEWFSPRWTLFNECEILTHEPDSSTVKTLRPDRVMTDGKRMIVVDFKFGKPKKEYRDQVNTYKKQLHDMGYSSVEGYLWYVMNNKIEQV